jgi:ankyrin repeat family A protein 2
MYGQLKSSEKLLDFGANPNALAKNYVSPLHLAAAHGHHEIVRLLIVKGAKVSHQDICGNTALHYAAAGNFPHSTNEILSSPYADVMTENEDSKTAYHLSVENKAHLTQAVIENYIMNVIN